MVEQTKGDSTRVEQKEMIFWSRAAKHSIGNFREEQRYPDGRIKARELPLKFIDHIRICNVSKKLGKEEYDFIMNSDSLKNGDCRLVKSHEEARALTLGKQGQKSVHSVSVSSTESVQLQETKDGYTPIPGTEKSEDTLAIKG